MWHKRWSMHAVCGSLHGVLVGPHTLHKLCEISIEDFELRAKTETKKLNLAHVTS